MSRKVKIEVEAETILNPTEDLEKVKRVLHNLFDFDDEKDLEIIERNGEKYLRVSVNSVNALENLFEGFRRERIVQTARKYLLSRVNGDSVRFALNKQALYAKRFHFSQEYNESPMGPVIVTITSDDLETVLNYLVPETEKGVVLEASYDLMDMDDENDEMKDE
ncbi:MAG: RNA-binding domain-containing protein [Promethearchaeota archaeon]